MIGKSPCLCEREAERSTRGNDTAIKYASITGNGMGGLGRVLPDHGSSDGDFERFGAESEDALLICGDHHRFGNIACDSGVPGGTRLWRE